MAAEAKRYGEAAKRASDFAEAAARAAKLAGEAALLAADGRRHEAIARLREAQRIEEALGEAAAEQLLEGGADYSAVPKNPDKALRIFYEVAEDLDKLGETVAEQPSEGAERAAIPDLKMWTLVLGWQKASFPFLLHGISGIPPLFYICPCKGCTHKKYIFQAPISPPLCPEHRVELVLDEEGAQRRDCDA